MPSMFEPLLEHLVLGKKLVVPVDGINIESFKGAYFRYARGNVLLENKKLVVAESEEDGTPVYVIRTEKKPPKPTINFKIVD